MGKINKILIANRGEIAVRIMRTAREMGIKTVAVYSEADRHALHTRYADEAWYIGPPPSAESYLHMGRIIEAALQSGTQAIHPGYGFLSENALFAEEVANHNLIFIGPSPPAIRTMGSKLAARQAVALYGIAMVPGISSAITDIPKAKQEAQALGYPVIIKASAGGGGKGMRVVNHEGEFEEQLQRAISEAEAAFGDGAVFVEKYITSPRHIEVQVLGDQHGHIIHLFERECSIQRRHQKVIEEAPSSALTPELRNAMGEAAVKVAQACGYYGAGTVEFIVDEALDFYFLEMNTRLQVEHPVTEQVTGIDLVRQQILVAEGRELDLQQSDVSLSGHAIEVRVYAEDPANGFLPDTGTLHRYNPPRGPGIRVDDGFEAGMSIPLHYDPMIAKLIAHAATRELAIGKMLRAIGEYKITGVSTTLPFCEYVLHHEAFISGNFDTKFIEKYFTPLSLQKALTEEEEELTALAAFLQASQPPVTSLTKADQQATRWKNRSKLQR